MPQTFKASPDHPAVDYLFRLHTDLGGRILENRKEAKCGRRSGLRRQLSGAKLTSGLAFDPKQTLRSAGQSGFLSFEDGAGFAAGWGAATGCGFGVVAKCGCGRVGFKSLGGGAPPSGFASVFSGLGVPPFSVA
jgi:hypothetical protein